MINYKKLSAVALCAVMIVGSLAGCGKKDSAPEETQNQTGNVVAQAAAIEQLQLEFSDSDLNASWSENGSTIIKLTDSGASVTGSGVAVSGNELTINSAGTYVVSGTLNEGVLKVSCTKNDKVRIVLNGSSITSSTGEPFVVEEADKVTVTLADNTINTLSDKERTISDTEEYSAAFASKADTVINGNGTLNINANYRNGIKSSDDLLIVSGNYNITSKEDGIIGKDILGIKNGTFTINAGVDGLKSTNDTDETRGNIIIEGGTFNIISGNDGIQAESDLMIYGGTFDVKTGDGAVESAKNNMPNQNFGMGGGKHFGGDWGENSTTNTESIKGLKASDNILVTGGTFTMSCEDDAVHSNSSIKITGGNFTIDTGDDGIHADVSLQIDNGKVDIRSSYEGLEAASIVINGGDIDIVSSDDGVNASTGNDNAMPGGGMNRNMDLASPTGGTSTNSVASVAINGGELYINANGDGLDSNGVMTMSGGNVIICGPTDNGNSALDFDRSFNITGGTLMAFGSSGMLEKPSGASNGCCIVAVFSGQTADTEVKLSDSSGKTVMSYTPVKAYSSAVFYSGDIKSGQSYTVTAGTQSISVTTSDGVTSNTSGNGGMGGAGGMGGDRVNPGDGRGNGVDKGVPGGNMDGIKGNKMPEGESVPVL